MGSRAKAAGTDPQAPQRWQRLEDHEPHLLRPCCCTLTAFSRATPRDGGGRSAEPSSHRVSPPTLLPWDLLRAVGTRAQ